MSSKLQSRTCDLGSRTPAAKPLSQVPHWDILAQEVCIGVFLSDSVIGVYWLQKGTSLQFQKLVAWIIFTITEFRNRNIFIEMMMKANPVLLCQPPSIAFKTLISQYQSVGCIVLDYVNKGLGNHAHIVYKQYFWLNVTASKAAGIIDILERVTPQRIFSLSNVYNLE